MTDIIETQAAWTGMTFAKDPPSKHDTSIPCSVHVLTGLVAGARAAGLTHISIDELERGIDMYLQNHKFERPRGMASFPKR